MGPVKSKRRDFRADEGGNVAMLFALVLVPMIGFAGAALDYSTASATRSAVQKATDSAALAGAAHIKKPDKKVREAVQSALNANLPPHLKDQPFSIKIKDDRTVLQVEMQASVPTRLMRVFGKSSLEVASMSEARTGTDHAEVVLALDTTGTMRDHIPALRQASQELVKTLENGAGGSNTLKIGLVPYVTAVNLGAHGSRMSWMDVSGNAKFHGENFENVRFYDRRCDPPPPPPPPVAELPKPKPTPAPAPPPSTPSPPSPPSPPPAPPPGPPTSPDLGSLELAPKARFAEHSIGSGLRAGSTLAATILRALGPGAAHAGYDPWPYGDVNGPPDCTKILTTPVKVNHFDLFNAADVSWKGCVEARPYPYDVSDEPPAVARPDTLFVPYFWPDESDSDGKNVRNNYLPDAVTIPGWVKNGSNARLRQAWVWKYHKGPKAKVDTTSFLTQGPNAACPDPIVPLTDHMGTVNSALSALRAYAASGTNIAEGLAWAWRVVSPGEPFSEGSPYGPRNKKYIVLMTDGFSEVVPQGVAWNGSDYSSVGYAAKGRLGTTDKAEMTKKLDGRLVEVCRNIKDKQIQIFTVLYDPVGRTASSEVEDLLRGCATSKDKHAFKASSKDDLVRAFGAIAAEITALRLSQ